LGAKSSIVSGLHLKYSRFWRRVPETGRDQHCVVWDAVPLKISKERSRGKIVARGAKENLAAAAV
jgi:hypothetical protein